MENKACIEEFEEMSATPFRPGELAEWGRDIAAALRGRGHDPADLSVAEGEAEYYAEGWADDAGLVRGMALDEFVRGLTSAIATA